MGKATIIISSIILLFVGWNFTFNSSFSSENRASSPQVLLDEQYLLSAFNDNNNGQSRTEYELSKLRSPITGQIPLDINERSIDFVKNIPKASYKSSTWYSRGPHNVGGRTRALGIDINDKKIILAGGVSGGMWRSADGGLEWNKVTLSDQLHSVSCIAQDTRSGKTNIWYYGTGEYRGNSAGASFSDHFYRGDGIFKSTDNGLTWSQLASTVSNTVLKSEVGDFDFSWDILTDPSDTLDAVYAVVQGGIKKSIDGGTTWVNTLALDSGSKLPNYVEMAISPSGIKYAALSSNGDSSGLYRSVDGNNWKNITPPGWPSSFNRTVIGIAPSADSIVYFLSQAPSVPPTGHALWKYTYRSGNGADSGGVWEDRSDKLPNQNCSGFFTFNFGRFNTQNSYDICIAVKPDDPDMLYLGGTNIYRSPSAFAIDSDYTWVGGYNCDSVDRYNYIYPNHHPDQHRILFHPSSNDIMYSASDGGVAKTLNCLEDSVHWISLNNGYMSSQFYTVGMEEGNANSEMVIGGLQDNGTQFSFSNIDQQDWVHVVKGDGSFLSVPEGRDYYYLSWQSGKMVKCEIDDNGKVLAFNRMDPIGGANYLFINPFTLDHFDDNLLYLAGGKYVWRNDSLDAIQLEDSLYDQISTGWKRLDVSFLGVDLLRRMTAIESSTDTQGVVFYGTNDGRLYRMLGAHTSSPNVTRIGQGHIQTKGYISNIWVDPLDHKHVMVSLSNYEVRSIHSSYDGGDNWTHCTGNLEEFPDGSGAGPAVHWVSGLHQQGDHTYYAATSTGLYSTDSLMGDSTIWTQEGANSIGNVVVHMVKTRDSDGMIAIGTHGNGVFVNRKPAPVSSKDLLQNKLELNVYPNPFEDHLNFKFASNVSIEMNLELYDLSGKMVIGRKLVLESGHAQLNTSSLERGLYIYLLRQRETVVSGKVFKY